MGRIQSIVPRAYRAVCAICLTLARSHERGAQHRAVGISHTYTHTLTGQWAAETVPPHGIIVLPLMTSLTPPLPAPRAFVKHTGTPPGTKRDTQPALPNVASIRVFFFYDSEMGPRSDGVDSSGDTRLASRRAQVCWTGRLADWMDWTGPDWTTVHGHQGTWYIFIRLMCPTL